MFWACFLHFYQPPTQKKYWVDRITSESYRRLVKGLLENPAAKITLNINSILCELWDEFGHHDVLADLKTLISRGQIELTGSAKFHPLLPKLPKEMVVRQILLNEVTLNKYFGVVSPRHVQRSTSDVQRLKGFFPPEMAYDRTLAGIVAELGYEWIIAEELSLGKPVEYDRVYSIKRVQRSTSDVQRPAELMIFFRDRAFSYKILAGYLGTEKLFLDELKLRFPDGIDSGGEVGKTELPSSNPEPRTPNFLLTAMDGETFGHHRPGMEKLLFGLFKIPEVKIVHLSDLPSLFKKRESVETVASTWALMEHEVEKNLPFARWDDPENEVQRLQWQLTNLAIETVKNSNLTTAEAGHAAAGSARGVRSRSGGKTQISKPKLKTQNLSGFKISDSDLRFDIYDLSSGEGLSGNKKGDLKAEKLLDRALHSDQYWWASAKPWWSIEYIERGAKELLASIEAIGDKEAIESGRKLYFKILETAFDYQRSGRVDELSSKEDETIRMRSDQALPKMPKEELLKIISSIRTEMLTVAENQEYERAAQLRDRIKELEGYLSESVTN